MPTATGFMVQAALAREALVNTPTWPAAAARAVTTALPLLSHDLDERPTWESHARLTPAHHQRGSQRARVVSGSMELEAVYGGLVPLWALALGRMAYRIGGTANPETLAAGAYRHTIEIDPMHHSHAWEIGSGVRLGDVKVGQQLARRCTLAIDHQVSTWEFLSCMVHTLSLSADPGGVTLGVEWLGHSLDQASATNPNLNSLTQPAWVPISFDHLDFRLGAYSSSVALGSGESRPISMFHVELANNLTCHQTEATGLYLGECKRSGPARVSGSFEMPRYEADTFKAWARANTALMATAIFTGSQIAATGHNYSLAIYLPTLTLTELSMPTGGPGQLSQAFSFEATSPSSAAAGMPSVQSAETPLILRVTDADSAKALWAT